MRESILLHCLRYIYGLMIVLLVWYILCGVLLFKLGGMRKGHEVMQHYIVYSQGHIELLGVLKMVMLPLFHCNMP